MRQPASANATWISNLHSLITRGASVSPRQRATRECLSFVSDIDMRFPVVSIIARRLSHQFMAAEAHWILTGCNLVEPLARHAPSIRQFSDDRITFFGAYGPQIVPQLDYLTSTLRDDPHSRQAVATIWQRCPPKSRDIPCTIAVQWLIRDGALHCIDTMRSSDIWLGWPYDVFNFTMLTAAIAIRLRQAGVPTRLGTLSIHSASQHLYERNLANAELCIADHTAIEYQPFDYTHFESEQDLLSFLFAAASGDGHRQQWMSELFRTPSCNEPVA